jgi:hypothetical protein
MPSIAKTGWLEPSFQYLGRTINVGASSGSLRGSWFVVRGSCCVVGGRRRVRTEGADAHAAVADPRNTRCRPSIFSFIRWLGWGAAAVTAGGALIEEAELAEAGPGNEPIPLSGSARSLARVCWIPLPGISAFSLNSRHKQSAGRADQPRTVACKSDPICTMRRCSDATIAGQAAAPPFQGSRACWC